ncbi:MAG TPA: hypothetical protein VFR58_01170 [Flavisolibacter sp.]|nr:hypothetical protein [Flavisolibacter sp.]
MQTIDHLPADERRHFILCDCGRYVDMRDLSAVFEHLHAGLPEPDWSFAMRAGEPVAYTPDGKKTNLN